MTRDQREDETVRDYANEMIHLWKRVDPHNAEFPLLTHIQQGLRPNIFSRLGGTRVLTVKELLESCKAVERIIEHETKAAEENSIPDKGKRDRKRESASDKAKETPKQQNRRPN